MLDNYLKTHVQRLFIELYIYLASEPKTPENYRFFEEEHQYLKEKLILAMTLSGMEVVIQRYPGY
jgi:hypothetical protein